MTISDTDLKAAARGAWNVIAWIESHDDVLRFAQALATELLESRGSAEPPPLPPVPYTNAGAQVFAAAQTEALEQTGQFVPGSVKVTPVDDLHALIAPLTTVLAESLRSASNGSFGRVREERLHKELRAFAAGLLALPRRGR